MQFYLNLAEDIEKWLYNSANKVVKIDHGKHGQGLSRKGWTRQGHHGPLVGLISVRNRRVTCLWWPMKS